MSQSLYISVLDGERSMMVYVNDIINPVDEGDINDIAQEEEMFGNIDYIVAHFEIGEGESGTDVFISESDISDIADELGYDVIDSIADEITKRYGYEVELIQSESGTIFVVEE